MGYKSLGAGNRISDTGAAAIHLDGDFQTGKPCKFHCSPTCHPAQVGPEWVYGCTHSSWPQNQAMDFVPIVDCDGEMKKCEIPEKLILRQIKGLQRRIENALNKVSETQAEIDKLRKLLEDRS